MSTTLVCYYDVCFNGDEDLIALWMHYMAEQIDQLPAPEPWLVQLREWYRDQASLGSCLMHTDLHKYLTDERRRATFFSLMAGVVRRMAAFGQAIPLEELQRANIGGVTWFKEGADISAVLKVNRSVEKILNNDWSVQEEQFPLEKIGRIF
jgi:hypothetical protein